jgi:hypothetical protein
MDVLTLPAPCRSAITPVPRPVTIMRASTLALDLGTSTGWALQTGDDFISSGTVSLKHTRFDGGGMRFLRFRRWLEQLDLDAGPIAAVHFEEVRRHVGTDAAHVAYQGVPVGTIKQFIAGKGNADKAAVIAAVQASSKPLRRAGRSPSACRSPRRRSRYA